MPGPPGVRLRPAALRSAPSFSSLGGRFGVSESVWEVLPVSMI